MIYKPVNFINNTRSASTVTVSYVLPLSDSSNIEIIYSSVGKDITNIANNNITTANNIINHIVSTSGIYYAGSSNVRIRKDDYYGR